MSERAARELDAPGGQAGGATASCQVLEDSTAETPAPSLARVEALRLSDGRVLCVRQWPGAGESTLVLLHGLLDSSEGWECLGKGLRCPRIAFDLPGFGYSDVSSPGSIAGYARDVAEGLELLGIERFTLVGHSLGGAVATALAELMPSRVTALVLLAPAGYGRLGLAERASTPVLRHLLHATLPLALSNRRMVTAGYVRMVSNKSSHGSDVVEQVVRRGGDLVAGLREGTHAVVSAGRAQEAFYRRVVGYRGPVDVVWGDRDRLVPPSHRHGLRAALPHARVHLWHGIGHDPLRESYDLVIDLIEHALTAAAPAGHLRPAGATAVVSPPV
jgi:pimeloyl-ACP methyl ester carboxylesterase